MTRITKFFAIALCLALLLGTTAMAAPMTSPTSIIAIEDFERFAAGTSYDDMPHAFSNGNEVADSFEATLNKDITVIRSNYPLSGDKKWFAHRGGHLVVREGNGGKVLGLTTDTWYRGEFAYLLDDAWTIEESKDDQKALVVSADMALGATAPNNAMDSYGGIAYTFYSIGSSSIRNTGGSGAFGLVAYGTNQQTAAAGAYTPGGAGDQGFITQGPEYAYPKGQFVNMKRVIAPFRLTGSAPTGTDVANEMYYDGDALLSLNVFNHHYVRMSGDNATVINQMDNVPASAIYNFCFTNSRRDNQEYFDNIRIYEMSLNPEHFYVVEQTDGRYTEVKLDEEIKIYFSQPFADCADQSVAGYKASDIRKTVVITDSQSNVYDADDYTATISEEIVGDQIQGVLTIKMNQPMRYSETYTITLPSLIRNIARVKMPAASNRTVTVTTLPTPAYSFSFAEDTSAFTNSYKKFDVNATSLSSRETDSIILIGVYDALGNIQSYSFVSASFSPSSQEALSLSAQVAAGSQVRAYACGEKDQIATLDTYSYSAATPIEVQ